VKRLENELRNALDKIRAEDALKRKTSEFLRAEIRGRNRGALRFRSALVAVCAAFVLFAAGGFSLYLTPTAHIDFDVNPSVGLAVNRFGIVVDAVAYNDDGSDVLRKAGVKNKTYGEAAKTLLDAFISSGYLADKGFISATVQTNDKNDENKLLDATAHVVRSSLSDHRISAETDLFPVDAELVNTAHEHLMTPAKYLAVEELTKLDPTAAFEDCAQHSIGELRELIRAHSGEDHSGEDHKEGAAAGTGQSGDEDHKEGAAHGAGQSGDAGPPDKTTDGVREDGEHHGD
jgi:hypothetical protein